MNPETQRWIFAARIAGASLVCLFILAITDPNLGSVTLPNHKIGYGWSDALCVAAILAPLVIILIGAAWSRFTECVGWALLAILVVWRFVSFARISQ